MSHTPDGSVSFGLAASRFPCIHRQVGLLSKLGSSAMYRPLFLSCLPRSEFLCEVEGEGQVLPLTSCKRSC